MAHAVALVPDEQFRLASEAEDKAARARMEHWKLQVRVVGCNQKVIRLMIRR